MQKRHYYIYKGYYWYIPWDERKVLFHEANGLIVKCYTDEEFEKFYGDSCEVWERVKEDGN